MARGGLSAVRGGRRRTVAAEAALRQLWAAGRGSESCTTARGSLLWGYLGPRRVGRGGSTARCPRRRSWRSQEVLRWARASGNGPVSFSGRRGSRSRGQLELGGSGKESSAAARGKAAMEDGGGVPGQGESSALALREKGRRRNRTWLRWVVKRRREGSTRRRVVLPATRRRGDGVNWMEVMAFL